MICLNVHVIECHVEENEIVYCVLWWLHWCCRSKVLGYELVKVVHLQIQRS